VSATKEGHVTSTDQTLFTPPRVARRPMRGADQPQPDNPDRPLRVVLVSPPYFPVPPDGYGGVEAVLADLADALVAAGHEVTLRGVCAPRSRARCLPVRASNFSDRLGESYPEVAHTAAVRRAAARIAVTSVADLVHDLTLAGPLNAPAYAGLGLPTLA